MAVQRKSTLGLSSRGVVLGRVQPILYDDFNRADGALEGTRATTGQMWFGNGSGTNIVSGTIKPINGFVRAATIDVGQPDYTVQLKVASLASASFPQIMVRYCGSEDHLHLQYQDATHYLLEKRVNTSYTSVQSIAVTPTAGDVLKIACYGSTITCWINGTQQFTGTVAGISTTSGLIALSGNIGSGATFDELLVTP